MRAAKPLRLVKEPPLYTGAPRTDGARPILFGPPFAGGWIIETGSQLAPWVVLAHDGPMAHPRRPDIKEGQVQHLAMFRQLLPVLESLADEQTQRDSAGNRRLYYDQYIALLLMYFFNPIVTSLRAIQQASTLKQVQRKLGCARASLGSLSEAARVFDAALLLPVIDRLQAKLPQLSSNTPLADLKDTVTVVDSTLLAALPKLTGMMLGPCGGDNTMRRRSKLHVHYELLKAAPVKAQRTAATVADRTHLQQAIESGRLYVLDRGYAGFGLFADIIDAGSSLVCRMPENTAWTLIESREVDPAAQALNVISDQVVVLGGKRRRGALDQPMRVIEIRCTPHKAHWKRHSSRGGPRQGERIVLATDRLDLPADLVALLYLHRWKIETYFRTLKHVLGCRHLLSHCDNGIAIQTYTAIILSLLIALYTGRKPTLRTYEMICYYFTGLADLEELQAHIAKLPAA